MFRLSSLLSLAIIVALSQAATAEAYDPLAIDETKPTTVDLTVADATRDREIPLRVYLPAGEQAAPVVLFSHGLGGSRENNPYLGNHWSARGYVVVFMQHAGSDESVWRDTPLLKRMAAMRKAASLKNSLLRFQDVPAVIDQLTKWNGEEGHRLAGRMNLDKIGMSGHSFGALTTQAVSGQYFSQRLAYTDDRIRAAVAFSPSAPRLGDPGRAFGKVAIPWLLMTGTHDTSPIGNATVESRQAVFPALPAGDKYEVVLDQAEHSAFSERSLPGDRQARNPNHHRVILATSTAFWDAYLRDDRAAKAWLQGEAPRKIMEEKDRWQTK